MPATLDQILSSLFRIERLLAIVTTNQITGETSMAQTAQQIADEILAVGHKIDDARDAFAAQLRTAADRLLEALKGGDLTVVEAALTQLKTDADELADAAMGSSDPAGNG